MILNGQITIFRDYVKRAQDGYSIKALVMPYSCRIKIKYEGRSEKIYLLPRTAYHDNDYSAIANSTVGNPK